MADKTDLPFPYNLPHLRIDHFADARLFQPPSSGFRPKPSKREQFPHGTRLSGELAQAFAAARRVLANRDPAAAEGRPGAYVEVVTAINKTMPNLSWTSQGIRLGAIRADGTGAQVGGLFVPATAESFIAKKLNAYTSGPKSKSLTERFERVERIRLGTVETLWADRRPLPESGVSIWWECWCWRDNARNLPRPAERLGLRVSERRLRFPEFEVIPVYATREQIERLLAHSDAIEELRHASDTPHVFTHNLAKDQVLLVSDLAARVTPADAAAPAACILDTGVARAHPVIAPSLRDDDCHAVDEDWGMDDHYPNGHGTLMAGVALLGDLTYPVASTETIVLTHGLESVKLVPPPLFMPTDPLNYGFVTQSAISLPEIEAADRSRAFCMAVTNKDLSGDRPTSWSAALDQAAAGVMPADQAAERSAPTRLVVVSAGNIPDTATPAEAAVLENFPIEDPAQAWNVLTVGGFTDRDTISLAHLDGWRPAASVGDRSPYSRVSTGWSISTPIKPEIVLEAGNRALSPAGTELLAGVESLSVLTTNKDFIREPLTPFWATSSATAEAARMAAVIMAAHPEYWPETVRGLLVHSAHWTPAMHKRFRVAGGRKKRNVLLAREFGYGVPNLARALSSARPDVALISQADIQPFQQPTKPGANGQSIKDGNPKYKDLHYYPLPWPRRQLEDLGEKKVELKVTLSYFIEPSPGQMAPVTPASYRSHGLRFDLKRHDEPKADFFRRINDLELAEEANDAVETVDDVVEVEASADDRWMFGPNSRARRSAGSLHCDVWRGRGVELASRHTLAVYPVAGWWKNRIPQKRAENRTRYSLIVTLTCVDEDVDLYSEIEAEIEANIAARSTAEVEVS